MTSVQERLFDVRGTRAIVTGAASGLGFAMAEVLAECGARVTLADIDGGRLDDSTEKLRSRGLDARSVVADVGEDVLRGLSLLLFTLPRRIVAGTLDGAGNRLHDAAKRLGKGDPLDDRVTALEKRLAKLEKPGKAGARTQPSEQRREHEPAQPEGEANTLSSRTSSKPAG